MTTPPTPPTPPEPSAPSAPFQPLALRRPTPTSQIPVETPHGRGVLLTYRARSAQATLLMSHGAGNGVEARDLQALARHLPRHGISVVLFEQPWRVAGRKIATAPPTLDAAFVAGADRLRVRTPLVVGGRSAGARSAARVAKRLGSARQPEVSRLGELRGARVRTLVVQGERDAMGTPDAFPHDLEVAVVPAADHGFKVPARGSVSQDDALAVVVESTLEWIVREVVGNTG